MSYEMKSFLSNLNPWNNLLYTPLWITLFVAAIGYWAPPTVFWIVGVALAALGVVAATALRNLPYGGGLMLGAALFFGGLAPLVVVWIFSPLFSTGSIMVTWVLLVAAGLVRYIWWLSHPPR